MEGYNPVLGCTMGCRSFNRTWVPAPRLVFPRRDPLVDAVGRTDNPCDRPARCGPCCAPLPKFRLPKEKPECNLSCYCEEQRQSKQMEECQKCCPAPPTPEMVIEPLDPTYPIAVELPDETPLKCQRILVELPCRTNIIAGFFNPDDNKTPEERLKEQCDVTHLSCGPNLPMYPCRGVIQYPKLEWTTVGEQMDKCNKFICEGTKFCEPQYVQEQLCKRKQKEMEIRMEKEQEAAEEEAKRRFFNPTELDPCCANDKLSLTPYCNCGCDMASK